MSELQNIRSDERLASTTGAEPGDRIDSWSEHAARALLESEERLAFALDAVQDGVWDWDLEHDRVYYSPRWCSMLGYELHELQPAVRAWPPLVHPDDFAAARAALIAHLKGETPAYEHEYRMRHKDGRWCWILGRGRVVRRSAEGRALRYVGTHVDVTARKQEETVLRAVAGMPSDAGSDAFLEALVREIGEGLGLRYAWIGTTEGDPPARVRSLAFWNGGRMEHDMSYALAGTPCLVAMGMRDGHHVAAGVKRQHPASAELAAMDAESYHGIALRDAAGRPCGMLTVIHDRPMPRTAMLDSLLRTCATRAEGELARRHAAAALAEREAQLARAQQIARMGSWTWNPQTGATTWSAQQYRQLGFEPFAIPAEYARFRERVHPDDIAALEQLISGALAAREPAWRHEFRLRLPDGTVRWIVGRAEIAYDAEGRAVAIAGTDQDVTERRHLEDQLRHAQKMDAVGRLAGGIAHDFNNLLTIISGTLDLVRDDLDASHPARADLDQVGEAAERARALVRQLLAFSRKQVLQLRPLDLNASLRDAERLLRRAVGEDVVLRLEPCEGPLVVRADAAQLEQVLVNLALNARDAMPEGGALVMRTRREGEGRNGSALLEVVDTGRGIAAEHLPRVFEPFFTTKHVGEGPGLGLAMVYGIATQLGGTVDVASREGEGATFTLRLPVAEEAPPRATRPSGPHGGRRTVLLVEDEPAVRATVRRMLERLGYAVHEAADGAEAVARWPALRGEVGIVLTDVRMPRMGGRELAETLRIDTPTLPIVFMSGYTDESGGGPQPRTAFLEKPVPMARLGEALRAVVDA